MSSSTCRGLSSRSRSLYRPVPFAKAFLRRSEDILAKFDRKRRPRCRRNPRSKKNKQRCLLLTVLPTCTCGSRVIRELCYIVRIHVQTIDLEERGYGVLEGHRRSLRCILGRCIVGTGSTRATNNTRYWRYCTYIHRGTHYQVFIWSENACD